MQRQMSAAAVASSVRLLYTTTGSCLERAARSQRWRPKNKTCVSALSLVILGYSCLSIVFLLVNTPPLLRQAWPSVFTLAQNRPTLLFLLLHIKTEIQIVGGGLDKQPSQNQTAPRPPPLSLLQSSATTLSLCGTEWAPFMTARFMTPAFSDQGSRYKSPSKALSDTTVTSGLLWADWSALKSRL